MQIRFLNHETSIENILLSVNVCGCIKESLFPVSNKLFNNKNTLHMYIHDWREQKAHVPYQSPK